MAHAVPLLSDYVRIRTDHPSPDYPTAVAYLVGKCKELFGDKCEIEMFEYTAAKPNLIVTIAGQTANTIILSSHMDVVPVEPEHWTEDPFGGLVKEGKIYGRGTQDMKCVGVAYMVAVGRLLERHKQLKKTVKLVFTVDEEIGSADGMESLIEKGVLTRDDVDICLDEGCPSPFPFAAVFNGERYVHCITINITGQSGHASAFLSGTVGEKLSILLERIYKFRSEEILKMAGNIANAGSLVAVNVTGCSGGIQFNVVPGAMDLGVSIRCPPRITVPELQAIIDSWLDGLPGVSWHTTVSSPPTPITDPSNPYLQLLLGVLQANFGVPALLTTFPGASDSRYLRAAGMPAINVTPIVGCTLLAHDHDEFMPVEPFLRSIDVYEQIIGVFMG